MDVETRFVLLGGSLTSIVVLTLRIVLTVIALIMIEMILLIILIITLTVVMGSQRWCG